MASAYDEALAGIGGITPATATTAPADPSATPVPTPTNESSAYDEASMAAGATGAPTGGGFHPLDLALEGLGAPKRGVDWLARKGAALQGIPAGPNETVGTLARAGVGLDPGQEENPGYAKRIGGRVIQMGVDIGEDPLTWALFGAGAEEAAGKQAASFIGPRAAQEAAQAAETIAAGGRAATVGRAAAAAFVPGMAMSAYDEGTKALENITKQGITPETAEELFGAGTSAAFALGAGKHALGLHGEPIRVPRDMAGEARVAAEAATAERARPEAPFDTEFQQPPEAPGAPIQPPNVWPFDSPIPRPTAPVGEAPVDVLAERDFLRPNPEAAGNAEMLAKTRQLLAERGQVGRDVIAAGEDFEPDLTRQNIERAMAPAGNPRLAGQPEPTPMENVRFSPAAEAAAREQGVRGPVEPAPVYLTPEQRSLVSAGSDIADMTRAATGPAGAPRLAPEEPSNVTLSPRSREVAAGRPVSEAEKIAPRVPDMSDAELKKRQAFYRASRGRNADALQLVEGEMERRAAPIEKRVTPEEAATLQREYVRGPNMSWQARFDQGPMEERVRAAKADAAALVEKHRAADARVGAPEVPQERAQVAAPEVRPEATDEEAHAELVRAIPSLEAPAAKGDRYAASAKQALGIDAPELQGVGGKAIADAIRKAESGQRTPVYDHALQAMKDAMYERQARPELADERVGDRRQAQAPVEDERRAAVRRQIQAEHPNLPPEAHEAILEDRIKRLDAEQAAGSDPVTGLRSRIAFEKDLAGHQGGIASLDMAGLGYINDKLGGAHDAGDQFLKSLGTITQNLANDHGVQAYRIGGDEFALLGPDVSTVHRVAQAIQDDFREAKIHVDLPDGQRVTYSGGRIDYGAAEGAGREGFKSADQRLYEERKLAKARGERAANKGDRPPGLEEVSRQPAAGLEAGGDHPAGAPPETLDNPQFASRPIPGQRGLPGVGEDVAAEQPRERSPEQRSMFTGEMLQPTEARTTEGREGEGPLFRQDEEVQAREDAARQGTLGGLEVLKRFPGPEGTESVVMRGPRGWVVQGRDVDTNQPFQTKIFPFDKFTREQAEAEARKITEPEGGGSVRFATKPSPMGFYSQLERVAEKIPQPMKGADMLRYLSDAKRGVKADELKWTGVDDFLKSKGDARVTPKEVQDFIAANKVDVKEVKLGGKLGERYDPELRKRIDDLTRQIRITREDAANVYGEDRTKWPAEVQRQISDMNSEVSDAVRKRDDAADAKDTQFQKWQIPGGQNYRELLLTLPEKNPKQLSANDVIAQAKVDASGQGDSWDSLGPNGRQRYIDDVHRRFSRSGDEFRGGHFDEPNVLAHVRFNDRTDANGKKTLFIEEIQSDWAQKGRREGFKSDQKPEIREEQVDGATVYRVYVDGKGKLAYSTRDAAERYINEQPNSGIVQAPFVGKTEAWSELALKHVLKHAAENGYDSISWTPGEVQNERYDLSKKISRVTWNEASGEFRAFDHSGQRVTDKSGVKAADLPDIIGKDAADKLIQQQKPAEWSGGHQVQLRRNASGEPAFHVVDAEGTTLSRHADEETAATVADMANTRTRVAGNGTREISGLDLKVGGEGMKGFYDKIIPQIAGKLGKKWGATVGETEIRTGGYVPRFSTEHGWIVQDGSGHPLLDSHGDPATFKSGEAAEKAASVAPPEGKTVHALPITDAMRRSVTEEGQPLFAGRGRTGQDLKTHSAEAERAAVPMGEKSIANAYPNIDAPLRELAPRLEPLSRTINDALDLAVKNMGVKAPIKFAGFATDGDVYGYKLGDKIRVNLAAIADASQQVAEVAGAKVAPILARRLAHVLLHETLHQRLDEMAKQSPEIAGELDSGGHGPGFARTFRAVLRRSLMENRELRRRIVSALEANNGAMLKDVSALVDVTREGWREHGHNDFARATDQGSAEGSVRGTDRGLGDKPESEPEYATGPRQRGGTGGLQSERPVDAGPEGLGAAGEGPLAAPERSPERAGVARESQMGEAIALGSPSGRMSGRAREATNERLRTKLFGEEGLQREPVAQPSERDALLRKAKELRDLADRGMKPRAYRTKADALEREAAALEPQFATAPAFKREAAVPEPPLHTEVGGRPVEPDETPRVEGHVSDLREAEKEADVVPAELDRETRQTWKSLDPEVKKILRDTTNEQFFNIMKRRNLDAAETMAFGARVRGMSERRIQLQDSLAKATQRGDGSGDIQRELIANDLNYIAAQRASVNDKTGTARALAAAGRVMDPSQTPDDAFLKRVLREIPNVSDRQAGEMLKAFHENPDNLVTLLHGALGHGKLSMLLELYKANLLTAFSTDLANLSGNVAEHHIRLAETGVSSVVDSVLRSALGGNKARFAGEFGSEWAGANQAIMPALSRLGTNLRQALFSLKEKPIDPTKPLDRQVGAIPGKFGKILRGWSFGKLDAADDFFKDVGGSAELGKLAYRKAAKELGDSASKGDIAKRTAEIMQQVADPENTDHADLIRNVARSKLLRTFQEHRPGSITESMTQFLQRHPWLGFAIPFVRVPGNIAARIIQRSPLGAIEAGRRWSAFKEVRENFRDGKASQAEFDEARGHLADAIAPPLLGTAILGGFAAYAAAGGMTGSGPTDPKKRNLLRDTGWSPYSFVFDNGGKKVYIPFNRFEPVSSLLGFAADMAEAKHLRTTGDLFDKGVGSIVQNLTNKTYLQGIADVANLASNPKQFASQYVKGMAGALLVPNIVARAATAVDPTLRDTTSKEGGVAGTLSSLGKSIQARVPFASESLPARRAGTGEEIERPGNALTRFALPAQPTEEDPRKDFERYLVNELNYVPSEPSKTLTIAGSHGKQVTLNDVEFAKFQDAHKAATAKLRSIVASPRFQAQDPEDQKSFIEKTYREASDAVRKQIFNDARFRARARAAMAATT